MLAQVPNANWSQIVYVIGGLVGLMAIALIVLKFVQTWRATFATPPDRTVTVQPVTVEFTTRNELKEVLGKMEQIRDELKLDGSRRSKTLFEAMKTENTAIYERLNEHDRQIARHAALLEVRGHEK